MSLTVLLDFRCVACRYAALFTSILVLSSCTQTLVRGRVFEDQNTTLRNARVWIISTDKREQDKEGTPAKCIAETDKVGRFFCTEMVISLDDTGGTRTFQFKKGARYNLEVTAELHKSYSGNFVYPPLADIEIVLPKALDPGQPGIRPGSGPSGVEDGPWVPFQSKRIVPAAGNS